MTFISQLTHFSSRKLSLPSTHLSFDVKLNEIESYSFAAYSYLRSVKKDFATVIFSGSSGIGFDTLKARHQGLACYNSRFIVNIDDALPSKKEIVITGDARALVTDIKVLKKEFMYQMSAQYAVRFSLGFF